jgi:glycosyltransferase involved in cell wall biosynthesis
MLSSVALREMADEPRLCRDIRVSCVTTFLNAERYLAEAIESVIAQNYPHWELLLVDDGSTDGSRAIAKSFVDRFPERIRLLFHSQGRNEGKSVSRNLGIASAASDIIALLDADDIWMPDKLDAQMQIFANCPQVDFVYGPVIYHYGWTGRPQDAARDFISPIGVPADQPIAPPLVTARMLEVEARRQESICPYPSAVSFRRSLFDRAGGFEPEFRQVYDDAIFFAKALAVGCSYATARPFCKYRLHPAQRLSHSYENAAADSVDAAEARFLNRSRTFFEEQQIVDKRLRQALAEASRRYQSPHSQGTLGRLKLIKPLLARHLRPLRRALRQQFRAEGPRNGTVRWGDLGRSPIAVPGHVNARGGSIPDHHFELGLKQFAHDLRGDCAEFGDDVLLRRHCACPAATFAVLDPGRIYEGVAWTKKAQFDCILAHDMLRFCANPFAALTRLAELLKPGGRLLASLSGVAPTLDDPRDRWRFTTEGAQRLFAHSKDLVLTDIQPWGGLDVASAVLHGMGLDDLPAGSRDRLDKTFPVTIFVRAERRDVDALFPKSSRKGP